MLMSTYVACHQTHLSKKFTMMQHSGSIIEFTAANKCMAEFVALPEMNKKKWAMKYFFGTSILTVKNNPRIMVIYSANFI